ncbi:hypothetical protein I546_2082 [Mycobacterium kansasii 732]|nr:hypothetical protein I546_2082 [Mycobacterium kansasii 732]
MLLTSLGCGPVTGAAPSAYRFAPNGDHPLTTDTNEKVVKPISAGLR